MNIKSLFLGTAMLIGAMTGAYAAQPGFEGGGGGSPAKDPFELAAAPIDTCIAPQQLAAFQEGGLIIQPAGDVIGFITASLPLGGLIIEPTGDDPGSMATASNEVGMAPQTVAITDTLLGKHPILPWNSAEGEGGKKAPIPPSITAMAKPIWHPSPTGDARKPNIPAPALGGTRLV